MTRWEIKYQGDIKKEWELYWFYVFLGIVPSRKTNKEHRAIYDRCDILFMTQKFKRK